VQPRDAGRTGFLFALAAFGFWGMTPIYFHAVRGVPAVEVLAHRVVWSLPLTALMITVVRDWGGLRIAVRDLRTMRTLLLSSTLVALNWLTYIYGVTNERIVETSLGYFVNPLVNVLLGMVFLGERLTRAQTLAVVLAAAGTLNLTLGLGRLPWIALTLAVSFGLYGLMRKTVRIESVNGLFVEIVLLSPLAAGYLAWLAVSGGGAFSPSRPRTALLLAAAGLVTALPLVWYTSAARRLRYVTIGLLQYIAPCIQLAIGVLLYHEPFTRTHRVTFTLIWIGLAIFTLDALSRYRRRPFA
jgi:chloramphenicol-sensitive protein RarD